MELGPVEFQKALDELRPQIGNYNVIMRLIRLRARKTGGNIPYKLYKVLKLFCNPKKPYFIEKTRSGLLFVGDYRDNYSIHCVAQPEPDQDMTTFLKHCMEESNGAFLDVGTNLGIVAATMAKHLTNRETVFAFEPVPETAKRAAATFALNGLTNIRLFQMAISDVDEETTFFVASGHSEGSSANKNAFVQQFNSSEIKVISRRLDSLLNSAVFDQVGLVKIDVEGHELRAVRGGQNLFARDKPQIIFEYHPAIAASVGWSAREIPDLLTGIGYKFHVIQENNSLAAFPPIDSNNLINIYGKA